MNAFTEIREIECERIIPALPPEVFDAWLDPKSSGSPFHDHDKLIVNSMVDGLWHWLVHGQPHYGRFTEFRRPSRFRHTWVSPSTLGEETLVTVTFQKGGEGTLMTLMHSGFPSDAKAQAHKKAWNGILDKFARSFGKAARQRK